MRIIYHKEIEFILKKIFFSEKFLLKRRLERAVKNKYEPELKLIKKFITHGTDSLDIGIYKGVYSYEISKYAKTVHAFELNPIIFPFLNRNLYKIINNIKLYNFGLSNKNGKTALRIPIRNKLAKEENYEEFFEMGRATIHANNEFNEFRTFNVNVKKLDDIQFENSISFIKIDAEGHEIEVIEGAIKTINKNKPILLVEIDERHSKKKVIDSINFINSLGYKSYYFNEKELINTAILTNFDTYNNYIFKPT